ncbi:hypothetical protein [Streptomyces sp. JJ36]|uniref:hypothetical protein n=1 Tax=Streptomyces sp. JJ36 TaxID=2736645 RepID=UPI001F181579|nr:hypothetical protein [Streptomyces sp. JJ36]MCF6524212.1 hypothetical protein [Streptomyces sp. JJ36]
MSIGGDEYDERGRTGGTDPSLRRGSARLATRTRLPGEDGDVYGVGRRSAGRPGRSLLMVMSVVVLLIAAIAFANRGGGTDDDGGDGTGEGPAADARPTAPSGERPAGGEDGVTGIPTGYAHTEQGAQSAAANYAVALGGDQMFRTESRHAIVDAVYTPQAAPGVKQRQDEAYTPGFLRRLGLEENGAAPDGQTFVSRAIPVGTELREYSAEEATVAVWYTGLIGMAGEGSQNPVRTTWQTWTFQLDWTGSDWKIAEASQQEGPAPVPGDVPAAGAEEISKAVQEYGGFTYAR